MWCGVVFLAPCNWVCEGCADGFAPEWGVLTCGACPLALPPPQMAVEKLKQGIDGFAADQRKLEDILAKAAEELSNPKKK